MPKQKIYQVDAFTDQLFAGNPAAVCPLSEWLPDEQMQKIANENNLAETAFVVPKGEDFFIRWFTPTDEVALCGHATLASAFVFYEELGYDKPAIRFHSVESGVLTVSRADGKLFLDFPVDVLVPALESPELIAEKIGVQPSEVLRGKTDLVAFIDTEESLRKLQPDITAISKLGGRGLIVTAKGDEVDFVSRFFAPQVGVGEDSVTGSAHTSLIPLWADKLSKTEMTARQLSQRGGQLWCELRGDRCIIGGHARLYLVGEINLE
ncbi:MAG: PhzF family phenazine biosynthesis protein [Bacteroidota bacterium]